MAWRLEDYLIEGYFRHHRRNSTGGRLALRGCKQVIAFELTGDPGPTLQGRSFEFRPREAPAEPKKLPKGFAPIQVGPTGTMDMRLVKVALGDIVAAMQQRKKLEFEWKPCLTLEWYSQNGRVVLELVDPDITLVEGDPIPQPDVPEDTPSPPGMHFSVLQFDDTGQPRVESFAVTEKEEEADDEAQDIDSYLDNLNRERENAYRCRKEEMIEHMEMADRLIERQETGEFIGSLLEPKRLPPAFDVDEEHAEGLVKSLLAEMAMRGVGVHLCEHCTWREAYAFLLDEIIHKERVPRGLAKSGWTQNFDYGETCAQCEAEAEERWKNMKLEPEE